MSAKMMPLTPVQRELYEMSKATETKFTCAAPEGRTYLPFQLAGIEYGVHAAIKNVLLGDEPGLGKTVQAIGIANHKKSKHIFVACPAKLRSVWEEHLNNWLAHDADFKIVSYNYLANPDNIKTLTKGKPFDLGIWDEVHNLKNQDAKRTKYSLAKNGVISNIEKNICISGTPIQNRPIEIYPIAKTMAPQTIGDMDKFGFAMRYCQAWKTPWGSWDMSGADNLKELGIRFRSNFMVRRTKDKVLKDLPDKFLNLVFLETKEGNKAVHSMASLDAETVIKGGAKYTGDTHLSTLREEVGVSKIEFAIEYIAEQLAGGHQKMVVFAHHKKVIQALREGLLKKGISAVFVLGGMSDVESKAAIDQFQNDPQCKVFGGSLQATKEGITLTAASYVLFIEFSWVPTDNEQAMDRCHRIGQKDNVMVEFLVHRGSLDERMAKFNIEKSKIIREFSE